MCAIQSCVKLSTPNNSIACWTPLGAIIWSNHFHYDDVSMVYPASRTSTAGIGCSPPHDPEKHKGKRIDGWMDFQYDFISLSVGILVRHSSVVWGLSPFVYVYISWSQNFSQVPVRTVIRPLQHVDSSDLQQFCCRLAGLVRTIVLLRDLISARL